MMRYRSGLAGKPQMLAMAVLLGSATVVASTAVADEGVLVGFFRGSEMKTTAIGEVCFNDPAATFGYVVLAGVSASVSGDYDFSNTGHHYSRQSQIAVYTAFDPADPTLNRVGWSSVDTSQQEGAIPLAAGQQYTVVVQSFGCGDSAGERGEWSWAYRGPGALSGPSVYPLPNYGSGEISGGSPSFNAPWCGQTRYASAGPVRVPVTGDYDFSDSSVHFGLDIELGIYAGGFNPAAPEQNLINVLDDGATVRLNEGVDYHFVAAPFFCEPAQGRYQYVLLGPSGEFVITEGVNGAWANFDTLGQGQLMEVYPDINLLFTAWFTWDTTQPDPGETAEVGDPNHRWLTAQGGFAGDTATLDMTLSRGGLFDDPAPVNNESTGNMTIQFMSCSEAEVTYDLGDRSGSYTMNRLANDNIATCEMLTNRHKVPVQ